MIEQQAHKVKGHRGMGQDTRERGSLIKEIKARDKGEDSYRRRENNKGHKQKCHLNSMKQYWHTSEEHRGAPPWNGQQHYNDCCDQKTTLKSWPHILRVIQQYSSEEYWNHLIRKKVELKN
jgi:hypothetical protein